MSSKQTKMRLIEEIMDVRNIRAAITAVKGNHGAAGVDKMPVGELDAYFAENMETIRDAVLSGEYKADAVRRVYIPKPNGKMRPLGIPTVVDRVVQQSAAQVLSAVYDPMFSEWSYGFRPGRSCHMAIRQALEYLNAGYEWVVDFDIEKYFDTVNHDKLISIMRERVNDAGTLRLIRTFLRAGVMENGVVSATTEGVPQGGCISPILANIYLDKLDKELESRGLRFVRYADDFDIFVRSEKAAERVMASVSSWLERKLKLKVSASKTKVVRPTRSKFLGFTFWKDKGVWKCCPTRESRVKLVKKMKAELRRRRAVAKPLADTFTRLNQIIKGWINYFGIGSMKTFLYEFGQWLRHKVRVVIIKQWKNTRTIFKNLCILRRLTKANLTDEDIMKVAGSRLGWYRRCSYNVVNFLLSPAVLATPRKARNEKEKSRPGLVDPLDYYTRLQYKSC